MVKVYEGGAEVFDSMVLAPPSPTALNQVQQSFNNFTQNLGGAAVNFFEAIQPKIAMFDYDKMQRIAYAAHRSLGNFWMQDVIQPLTDIGQLQHAPDVMVRWLMAEPTTRRLYHQNQCEGYDKRYIDRHPGLVGEDHYDYMVVNDGIMKEDGEGGMYSIDYFIEQQLEYDPAYDKLQCHDQDSILTSWAHLANLIQKGEDDPTSKFNASL